MATFKFDATIYVEDVETAQEALIALQIALDDYVDMNPGGATIIIYPDRPERFLRIAGARTPAVCQVNPQ